MTGDRLTVGVVTPHAAAGPEVELPAMTRGRVATVVSRTGPPPEASRTAPPAHAVLRASTGPAALDRAAVTFGGRTLAAVAHASTTSGYVIGHRAEAALVERLSQRFGVDAVVTKAVDLPDDPARVDPQRVIEWVEHHVDDRAEAVFLAGNGFRAAGAVEELELRTGRLVLEANQALLWGILAATGTGWDVTGHGRLLRASTSTT